ncbi:MAG: cation:dicarboxylase symporter family transporter, partial [Olegusella sp.]|nr:cation:dicarboxylase symporter family transporter [Olegusella sp.]
VTISVMAMTAAHTLGISIDFPSALILCLLSAVGAAGTSGVAGGSLMLIPLACSFLGIGSDVSAQMIGIGFIIGVLQDATETALNSSSDALLTATAEFHQRRAHGIPIYMPKRGEIPPEASYTIDEKTGKPIIVEDRAKEIPSAQPAVQTE